MSSPGDSMTDSVAFQLAKLGQVATARFVDRLAPLGLRPRHCAVLALLAGPSMSQLELANRIGVTPSVVGEMLDELQAIGAVRRIRDDSDRRRQLTELTARGRALSRRANQLARQIDDQLLTGCSAQQAHALRGTLRQLAQAHDVPGKPYAGSPTHNER